MKAGVAVQLKLAAELVDPAVDVTWIWYDHEEVSSDLNGLGRLAAPPARPARRRLRDPRRAHERGRRGRMQRHPPGRRAHPRRARALRPLLGGAQRHPRRRAACSPRWPTMCRARSRSTAWCTGRASTPCGIAGGVAGNVIPDECVVHVNYRFAPSRSVHEAVAHVREVFAGFEVTVVDVAEGARPGLDAPLARQFLAAVGGTAKPKYGWTDVARFSALGIPAVNYGPGDPLKAHADDERVDIQQIVRCETGLRAWLSD